MTDWIALFRGINVGGHHIVPMKALRDLLEKLGCEEVASYIQSGNVVFRHQERAAGKMIQVITKAMKSGFGFRPKVLLLTRDQLAGYVKGNPFPAGESEPKTLHIWFPAEPPSDADLDGLNRLKSKSEKFLLAGGVFYLHAPDGIGRSKLAAKVEKSLGVPATARNWRT